MHWSAAQRRGQTKASLSEAQNTERYKRGETEGDAEREQRLSRMRDYARSRREEEDGVYIAHRPTDGCPWLSGCK